jgi:hypothetical protein
MVLVDLGDHTFQDRHSTFCDFEVSGSCVSPSFFGFYVPNAGSPGFGIGNEPAFDNKLFG